MADGHEVVSGERWMEVRRALLAKEKAFTKARDELSRERRALPWEVVTKDYAFEGPAGSETLPDLFAGRTQLVVYHFMFAPEWDAGCPHCSRWADNFNGIIVHLNQRDVTMVAVSRAPYAKLAAYHERMGWSFKWLSSHGSDFNFDFHVSFAPEELTAQARALQLRPAGSGRLGARGRERVHQGIGGASSTPTRPTRAGSTC